MIFFMHCSHSLRDINELKKDIKFIVALQHIILFMNGFGTLTLHSTLTSFTQECEFIIYEY